MKTPDISLFQLVHSLTASEKRYFKRFAQRHAIGQMNRYAQLFDAISDQTSYDESALKDQFEEAENAPSFAVLKHYLYQQLLDALHAFHSGNDIAEQTKKKLHYVELLLDKGLIGQAQKQWKKAEKAIRENELYALYPGLALAQRHIWERSFFKNITSTDLETWRKQLRNQFQLLEHEMDYAYAHAQLSHLHYQKIGLRNPKAQALASQIMSSPLFQEKDAPQSLRAKVDRHRTASIYHFMQDHPAKAHEENQALLHLFEAHPLLFQFFPRRYLSVLHNFLIDNLQLQKFEVLTEGLQKLKALPQHKALARIPKLEARIFELSTLLELNMWMAQRQFDKAYRAQRTIKKGLQRFGNQIAIHNRLSFYYLLALACFEKRAFAETQDWLNELLQSPHKNTVEELYRFARLLSLLTHFELNHFELLPYQVQSYRRQYTNQLYQSEEALFLYFRQVIDATSRKAAQQYARELQKKLEQLRQHPSEIRIFNYFDLSGWAKGRE